MHVPVVKHKNDRWRINNDYTSYNTPPSGYQRVELASLCQQLACHKFCNKNNEKGNIVRGVLYEQVILKVLQRQKRKKSQQSLHALLVKKNLSINLSMYELSISPNIEPEDFNYKTLACKKINDI